MNGRSYDYMLALDNNNCDKRSKARVEVDNSVKVSVGKMAGEKLPEIQKYFDQYGWEDMCNYVSWAYTESIELKDEFKGPLDVEKMENFCLSAFKERDT